MAMTIHKYKLDDFGITEIADSFETVLDVQWQNDHIAIWALINEENEKWKLQFKAIGTGWPFELDDWVYIKTVQDNKGYVWHIFMRDV